MTDPAADAAKLLPCPFCGSAPVLTGDDSYGNAHVLCQRCDIGFSSCDFPAVITDTKERKLATIIAAWNTRPQPAPPEGEPDFPVLASHTIPEWDIAPRVAQVAEFGERMYRLGLAARPKVEDGEVAGILRELRRGVWAQSEKGNNQFSVVPEQAADLLERLAGERDEAIGNRNKWLDNYYVERDERRAAEAKLAEREAELAKARDSLVEAMGCFDAAYAEGLAERLSEANMEIGQLGDLIQRRVLYAYPAMEDALKILNAARQQQKALAEPTSSKAGETR